MMCAIQVMLSCKSSEYLQIIRVSINFTFFGQMSLNDLIAIDVLKFIFFIFSQCLHDANCLTLSRPSNSPKSGNFLQAGNDG